MDSQCRPSRFLVVDDDAFMLKLIARTLQVLGHTHVLTCNSGASALAQLDGKTLPDVILCDLNMPGMDGVEFLRRLAQWERSCNNRQLREGAGSALFDVSGVNIIGISFSSAKSVSLSQLIASTAGCLQAHLQIM